MRTSHQTKKRVRRQLPPARRYARTRMYMGVYVGVFMCGCCCPVALCLSVEYAPILTAHHTQEQDSRIVGYWVDLQTAVSAMYDNVGGAAGGAAGFRQQLEHKEGLFRKNMMVRLVCCAVMCRGVYLWTVMSVLELPVVIFGWR